jgi:uncharacterized protein YbbC (DUF1343 family)
MKRFKKRPFLYLIFFYSLLFSQVACANNEVNVGENDVVKASENSSVIFSLGAENLASYLPQLANKKVGLVGNHATLIKNSHLVDVLLSKKVEIIKLFSPEHGFRGDADAGEKVSSSLDGKTGLPIFSLYGKDKKPSKGMLSGVEVMVFDLQDVGARFYTYISTLHYVMEACAENNIPLIVLDRPNPNGYYIDGPILENEFTSFVGLHPIPVVHGMTMGEYASMINGEKWLENGIQCDLNVVKMTAYDHTIRYELPEKPSPNLPNMNSIYLYPSLCFFEGTPVSVGRGTEKPFQLFGHPSFGLYSYAFTPKPMFGAKEPKLNGELCFGRELSARSLELKNNGQLDLQYLIDAFNFYPNKSEFFTNFFALLAGTKQLQHQIEAGMTAEEIRATWQADLSRFQKVVRSKYLLYGDF